MKKLEMFAAGNQLFMRYTNTDRSLHRSLVTSRYNRITSDILLRRHLSETVSGTIFGHVTFETASQVEVLSPAPLRRFSRAFLAIACL